MVFNSIPTIPMSFKYKEKQELKKCLSAEQICSFVFELSKNTKNACSCCVSPAWNKYISVLAPTHTVNNYIVP